MQLFFSKHISGNGGFLSEDETRHCISVLRKKEGDAIDVVDGSGHLHHSIITKAAKNSCEFSIKETVILQPLNKRQIHLAIAPTKNADRMEWLLEKAVEIGLAELSFIHCEHSEKARVNMERMEKIAISALKQSGQPYLTVLNLLKPFADFLKPAEGDLKLIAHCNTGFPRQPLQAALNEAAKRLVLIGPEGDFSESEIRQAEAAGFKGISLGESRLRTETAGLVAVTLLQ